MLLRSAVLDQDIRAEQQLSNELRSYTGEWVAIHGHRVVGNGKTASEAREKAPSEYERIFRVPRTTGSALL
jgi:hypothetical protein